jgi:hypothetical protein
VVRDALRRREREEQRHGATLPALRSEVQAGVSSGEGSSTEALFQGLEHKRSGQAAETIQHRRGSGFTLQAKHDLAQNRIAAAQGRQSRIPAASHNPANLRYNYEKFCEGPAWAS